MSKIVIRDPKGDERAHELVDPITTIGRGSSNTIQCKDREASRQHCRIEKTDLGFRLVDNRSRNGTTLNGQKTEVQDLRPGDVITIGGFKLQFDPPEGAVDEDFAATIEVAPLSEKEAAAPRASGGGDGKPKYVLEVVEGRQAGNSFELANDALTIGRNSSNRFPIDDESASSFHAEISKEPTGYFITDLGSTNGTRVGGEKIVKTRLSPGTEVQIGTTKMVFKNVGAPAEEDEVFGTVVLDTERLERELAEDDVRARAAFVRRIGVGAAALVALGLLIFGGIWLVGLVTGQRLGDDDVVGNVLPNASFDGGSGDAGEPEGWRAEASRSTPWSVKEIDRVADMPEEKARALVVAREGEAPIDEYTQCRVKSYIDVQSGKSYRLGGWIKAPDAQGAYGFRVRWLARRGEERSVVEQAYVKGSQTAWKRKEGVFTPPTWATRAEVACFAIGNRGTVCFDDVFFAPVDKRALEDTDVAFKHLSAEFSPTGVFDVKSGTELAVKRGELFFKGAEEAVTSQEYADAEDPKREANASVHGGLIPEFSSANSIRYGQTVRPGELGIVAEDQLTSDGPVSLLQAGVHFTVTGAFGYGKMEVLGEDGPLDSTEGEIEGAREVVFTDEADKDRKLAVHIGEGHKLRIETRGDERFIEVTLAGGATLGRRPTKLSIELNAGSRVERLRIDALTAAWKEAERSGGFSARHAALKDLAALADRFPKEAEEAKEKLDALEREAGREFAAADALVGRAKDSVESKQTLEVLLDEVEKQIDALKAKYAGGPYDSNIVELEVKVAEVKELRVALEVEGKAQTHLARARRFLETNPEIAVECLNTLGTEKYRNTKANKTAVAEGLRARAEGIINRRKEALAAYDEIFPRVINFVRNDMPEQGLATLRGFVKYPINKDHPKFVALVKQLEELIRKKNAGGAAPE